MFDFPFNSSWWIKMFENSPTTNFGYKIYQIPVEQREVKKQLSDITIDEVIEFAKKVDKAKTIQEIIN